VCEALLSTTDGALAVDGKASESIRKFIRLVVLQRILLVLVRGLRLDRILVFGEVLRYKTGVIARCSRKLYLYLSLREKYTYLASDEAGASRLPCSSAAPCPNAGTC
jgi:hypothetical protein